MPEQEEGWPACAGSGLRSARCEVPVTNLRKELTSLQQDAVGALWFPNALFLICDGMLRGQENAFSRIGDRSLAGPFDEKVELVNLYPRECFGRKGGPGPPDFHGSDPGVLSEAEVEALGRLALEALAESYSSGER